MLTIISVLLIIAAGTIFLKKQDKAKVGFALAACAIILYVLDNFVL